MGYVAVNGDIVQIHGLVGHTHLNGKIGRVIGKRQDGGILVDMGKGEIVPVLPTNLSDASGRSLSNSPTKLVGQPPPSAQLAPTAQPATPGSTTSFVGTNRARDAYEWRAIQSTGTRPPRSASPASVQTHVARYDTNVSAQRNPLYGTLVETGLNQPPTRLPAPPPNAQAAPMVHPQNEVYAQQAASPYRSRSVSHLQPLPPMRNVVSYGGDTITARESELMVHLGRVAEENSHLRAELEGTRIAGGGRVGVSLAGGEGGRAGELLAGHNYHTAYNAGKSGGGGQVTAGAPGVYNNIFARASFSPPRGQVRSDPLSYPILSQPPSTQPAFLQALERDFRR